MEMRYPVHQTQVERMTTDELRANFLVSDLFQADKLCLVYSHIDRVIMVYIRDTVEKGSL